MKNTIFRSIVCVSSIIIMIGLFLFVNLSSSQAKDKSITALSSIDTGLIMYYPLDGNLEDVSGNNRHATTNSIFSWVNNRALNFNGVDDYVKTPVKMSDLVDIGDPIHFSFWFKATPHTSTQILLGDPGGFPDFLAVIHANGIQAFEKK